MISIPSCHFAAALLLFPVAVEPAERPAGEEGVVSVGPCRFHACDPILVSGQWGLWGPWSGCKEGSPNFFTRQRSRPCIDERTTAGSSSPRSRPSSVEQGGSKLSFQLRRPHFVSPGCNNGCNVHRSTQTETCLEYCPKMTASCRCRCHSGRRLVFRETNLSPPTTYCNRCHRDCVAPFAKCPDFGIRPGGGRF